MSTSSDDDARSPRPFPIFFAEFAERWAAIHGEPISEQEQDFMRAAYVGGCLEGVRARKPGEGSAAPRPLTGADLEALNDRLDDFPQHNALLARLLAIAPSWMVRQLDNIDARVVEALLLGIRAAASEPAAVSVCHDCGHVHLREGYCGTPVTEQVHRGGVVAGCSLERRDGLCLCVSGEELRGLQAKFCPSCFTDQCAGSECTHNVKCCRTRFANNIGRMAHCKPHDKPWPYGAPCCTPIAAVDSAAA